MEQGQKIRDYILEQKLGVGGVGEVWRARHARLRKSVAIKGIFPHLLQDSKARERFLREAQAMACLEHPHVVGVHDFFMSEEDAFLVMSYIEGGSLQQALKKQGSLVLDEALRISGEILAALNYAHKKGIIHRDVKPSNILLNPDGHAYLGDFGIALVMGEKRLTRLTSTGSVIGTVEYMSPEQISGAKHIDHRTDVYSFGCVLYEMLTGNPPFGSRDQHTADFTLMQRHTKAKPLSVRQLNPKVDTKTDTVIIRALAKDPRERFGGCAEMAEALLLADKTSQEKREHPRENRGAAGSIAKTPSTAAVDSSASISNTLATLKVSTWILAFSTTFAGVGLITQLERVENLRDRNMSLLNTNSQLRAENSKRSKRTADLAAVAPTKFELTSRESEVKRLLKEAETAFLGLRLTTPKSDNAYDRYTRALELDPGNGEAQRGIKSIAKKYVELANVRIGNGDAIKARIYLDKVAEIEPNLEDLKAARTSLEELMAPSAVSIWGLRIFNAGNGLKRIGSYSKSFPKDEIRYIAYKLKYRNDSGKKGSIGVKYVRPDGTLERSKDSPPGFTFEFDVELGEGEHSMGWGNQEGGAYSPGTHRIEFWWKNRKLREKTFSVH